MIFRLRIFVCSWEFRSIRGFVRFVGEFVSLGVVFDESWVGVGVFVFKFRVFWVG